MKNAFGMLKIVIVEDVNVFGFVMANCFKSIGIVFL